MKFYLFFIVTTLTLTSCLKQSIADAMLARKREGKDGSTATLSYQVNGNSVEITVPNAASQNPAYVTLGCTKETGYYVLSGLGNQGETTFLFFTDSLTTGGYTYNGSYGEMYFISYNGENEYVHAASDYLTFVVTAHENGHISGNFSGELTPLISAGTSTNTFGSPGSVKITNGEFRNVPVFY